MANNTAAAPQLRIQRLEMRNIVKRFPGVLANDHVDFELRAGEIHALLGENGAGKSTTLASMLGVINAKYRKHIITLEDPIEYALDNRMCVIEQREIGFDCPSFGSALKR